MSSKHNDNNPEMIHLGNYEEFFILYMDGELSEEQMTAVDQFLVQHPDLQTEFEMLLSTKLPEENFSFDTSSLTADAMKMETASERLLLFIDNELPATEVSKLQAEMKSNKELAAQAELLQKTRLDASETIVFPDKASLYRKEENRRAIIAPWMRMAAAAAVILAIGGGYFLSQGGKERAGDAPSVAVQTGTKKTNSVDTNLPGAGQKTQQDQSVQPVEMNTPAENAMATTTTVPATVKKGSSATTAEPRKFAPLKDQDISEPDQQQIAQVSTPRVERTNAIEGVSPSTASVDPRSEILNNNPVTSSSSSRFTNVAAVQQGGPNATPAITGDVASNNNNNKGSVKGFLRKATRLIEKKTGIDPTNDGELLIAAVAINLK